MEQRTLALLEFPRVLARLASLAVSEPGRAAAMAVEPAASPEAADRERALTVEAVALRAAKLLAVPDFPSLGGLFAFLGSSRGALDLDALFALRQTLVAAKGVRDKLTSRDERGKIPLEAGELLYALSKDLPWPDLCDRALARCLGSDGAIRDDASPELFSIRQEIRSIHQKCLRHAKDFLQTEGLAEYLQDEYITISSDRYVLPLKSNFKGRLKGVIHDYSQTGETCYFEPLFLVELNNSLRELKNEERQAEGRILAYLTGLARQEEDGLRAVYAYLIELDVLSAKAALAGLYDGVLLACAPGAPLYLKNARHPLLALEGSARPLHLELADGELGLIISGANAGGKTVCLKTLGLLAAMAMSGLPVPAEAGGGLPFWRDIFVFMGDEQSLEGHLSTFTAQIRALARIWPQTGPDSLVLLDEFGAGTDPAQGAALAQAVVDGLLERGAHFASATHFPGLKAYALTAARVRAASMLFDPASKRPLYRLVYDQVGASNALEVAREHGLPEEILSRASQYLLLDGADSAKIFDRLNTLALEKEKAVLELGRERAAFKDKAKKLAEAFGKQKDELLATLKRQAQDILRRHAEDKIGRKQALKELAETRAALTRATGGLAGEPAGLAGSGDDQPPALADLRAGERVSLPGFGKTAVVAEVDLKRSKLKVEMGGVAMWLSPGEVRSAPGAAAPKQGAVHVALEPRQETFSLDLRGQRADEAVANLEAYLDQAILRGYAQVEIIHGKGTGALRREVHEALRRFPAVDSFATANADQGGDGMTIVTMK
jgi:DNA mismatch repair protein MutS2